jgi:exonuclease III
MVSKTGFKVESYNVLSGIRDGVYTSDHCPIILEVKIEK